MSHTAALVTTRYPELYSTVATILRKSHLLMLGSEGFSVGMPAPRWSNVKGSSLAVVALRKNTEDCTPGEVESAGQTIYRLALEPQLHNILVAASDQDAS